MSKRSREDYDNPVQNENEKLQGSRESTSSPSDSTVYFGPNSKLVHVDNGDGTAAAPEEVMRCSLPPHVQTPISFTSFEDYEVHYNKAHVNRCVECRKNFPTAHFLDLHISENHNPLLGILRDRGEHTYACFVEGCERKCLTPQKRRMHLIDKHMFPKDYDFFVVNDGIDYRTSMLRSGGRQRRSSAAQQSDKPDPRARPKASINSAGLISQEERVDSPDDQSKAAMDVSGSRDADDAECKPSVDVLASRLSSLTFVPPSVRFGRGRGRGGLSKT